MALSAVSTFHSIGLYWSGSGQTGTCNVQYRPVGSTTWKNGYPLVFDSRAIGGRPANEYRGSLVNLTPNTAYEITVTAGPATATINASTWNENFPVGSTTNLTSSTTISTSGTPAAYRVYTGSINGGGNNLVINASYIILRNMTFTGATNDAIVLQQNAHHVVIEGCDISGWGQSASTLGGNDQAAVRVQGFSYNATGVKQIVIQRCKIHDPRFSASPWTTTTGGDHPYGVNGINFEESGGNHVIRYNELYSATADKRFMDGIGGADNFTTTGFPGADSDIYANRIDGCYDDAIEAEGGGTNVRIWGNFLNNVFTGVSTGTCSIGPIYIWRNISNVHQRMLVGTSTAVIDGQEDRGPFNKTGSQDAAVRGGRVFLFHNTMLQPTQSGFSKTRGGCGGIVDNAGPVTNVVSRNNIWTSAYTNVGGLPIACWQGSPSGNNCTSDHDLLSPNSTNPGGFSITGVITGTPVYANGTALTLVAGGYYLTPSSPGANAGLVLNNFNDGFSGAAPDVGAYEAGSPLLEFGVLAYSGSTPPPPNQPPVANAGPDITITLPTSSTSLVGSGTDADGTITAYAWSKVSGPSGGTIASPTSATTNITALVQGTYVFRLTVTDNSSSTATDNVTVVVNPSTNQVPTANAGPDVTIQLPTNTTTLSGSGTDPDGTISSYAWSRVSGPNTPTISSPNTATTGVSNLIAGTYVFRLTVTDNGGATATDDKTVTVQPSVTRTITSVVVAFSDGTSTTIT